MKIMSRKDLEEITSEEQAVELLSQIPCEYTGIDFKFVGLPLTINVISVDQHTGLYHLVAHAPTNDTDNASIIRRRLEEISMIDHSLSHGFKGRGAFWDNTSIGRGYVYVHTIPVTRENTIRLKGNLLSIYGIFGISDSEVKDMPREGYEQVKNILDNTYKIWRGELSELNSVKGG